jgi:hypothetical protein
MGFTQPLTEMSTRSRKIILLGSSARPMRWAGKLTATCEPRTVAGIALIITALAVKGKSMENSISNAYNKHRTETLVA